MRAFALCICALTCACAGGETPTDPGQGPYFPRVRTVIQQRCLTCHSAAGSWTGRPTQFDTDEQIVAAAASIKSSVADPVTATNRRMPEDGTLTSVEIALIIKWASLGGRAID